MFTFIRPPHAVPTVGGTHRVHLTAHAGFSPANSHGDHHARPRARLSKNKITIAKWKRCWRWDDMARELSKTSYRRTILVNFPEFCNEEGWGTELWCELMRKPTHVLRSSIICMCLASPAWTRAATTGPEVQAAAGQLMRQYRTVKRTNSQLMVMDFTRNTKITEKC